MSGKAPRQQDLLGIYRSGKAAFQGGRGRERSACGRFIRMQPLFPISPRSKNLYPANLHTCVFAQIQSDLKLLTRFKMEYLPSVSAVTNTRGPGKWREGSLSLENITFEAQKGVHADGVLRQRSGPLFSLQPQPSEWNGSGVSVSHRHVPFTCLRAWPAAEGLIARGRRCVPQQRASDHRDLSRFSWRTCDRF